MTRCRLLSWFGQLAGPFLVPVKTAPVVARRRGQGRPFGRRGTRLALEGDEYGGNLLETLTIGELRDARAIFLGVLLIATPVWAAGAPIDAREQHRGDVQVIAAAVDEAAIRFDLPQAWIRAVLMAESGGRMEAVSPKGAMGLMQLMPSTWRVLSTEYGLGEDPFEPRANILAGAAYMRRMYDRFGSPGFLAAYNAGPERYARHLAGVASLPTETRNYVREIAPQLAEGAEQLALRAAPDWRASAIFITPGAELSAKGQVP